MDAFATPPRKRKRTPSAPTKKVFRRNERSDNGAPPVKRLKYTDADLLDILATCALINKPQPRLQQQDTAKSFAPTLKPVLGGRMFQAVAPYEWHTDDKTSCEWIQSIGDTAPHKVYLVSKKETEEKEAKALSLLRRIWSADFKSTDDPALLHEQPVDLSKEIDTKSPLGSLPWSALVSLNVVPCLRETYEAKGLARLFPVKPKVGWCVDGSYCMHTTRDARDALNGLSSSNGYIELAIDTIGEDYRRLHHRMLINAVADVAARDRETGFTEALITGRLNETHALLVWTAVCEHLASKSKM